MQFHKLCSKCKASKPSEDFFKDRSKPDGLYSQVCDFSNVQSVPYSRLSQGSVPQEGIHSTVCGIFQSACLNTLQAPVQRRVCFGP